MKRILLFFILLHQCTLVFSQETNTNLLFEDKDGKIITNTSEQKEYLAKRQKEVETYSRINQRKALVQTPVQVCSNGGFEEFVNENGVNVLKNFQYSVENPLKPIQCRSGSGNTSLSIKQYNPNDVGLMATTVPSNHLDEFIGNINGYDQYCLKLNYKESGSTMTLVQGKRFKTDNENVLKFNYKAVLQSIPDGGHLNEQPYFKARIVNNSGAVVSEFCLIADPENCIYTQAPILSDNNIILYTKNWQVGTLDISSIPNNENFTVEFMTTRCGLGGHFGYSYIDDICTAHSDENLQGNIELDPLYLSCPKSPVSICGNFTIPNSGNIKATVKSIEINILDSTNKSIYTSSKTTSLDLTQKRFCFDVDLTAFPDITKENYNVSATINYDIETDDSSTCKGTHFNDANDDDANPGWDITFINCDPKCTLTLQPANLALCDDDKNGKEFFDLTNFEPLVAGNQSGITFSYFKTINDATADTNPITNFKNYDSFSTTLYLRATSDVDCYKIIAVKLIVKNPFASITGVLNICAGSTLLTATKGVDYLWSTGENTQSINATRTGLYTVKVTDAFGCNANGQVTILSNMVAAQPTIEVTQPDCFNRTGTIAITSPASEYSYDDGRTWSTNSQISLPIGTYFVKIRTASGCESYNTKISLVPFLTSFPYYRKTDPKFCGDFGTITITTPASSYSFDDGVTWGSDNTSVNLPPGNYHILTKNEFGCISNFNNVAIVSEFLQSPKYTASNPNCSNLGSIIITTPASSYSFDGGTVWQTSSTLTGLASGSYVIKIKDDQGCTSATAYVYLTAFENTYPQYKITEAGCDTYASIEIKTPGDMYSFDNGLHWSNDPVLKNLNGGTSYQLIVKKGMNCYSRTNYTSIYSYFRPLPIANDFEVTLCDALNDGFEIINLAKYNSNLTQTPSAYRFEYYTSQLGAKINNRSTIISDYNGYSLSNTNNTVYVKVISQYGCSTIVALKFIFLDSPKIKMEGKYPLCVGKSIAINAGSGYNSYLWSDDQKTQTATLFEPGNYWVNVTENHGSLICNSTKKINVFLSNPATITDISIKDWSDTENVISVFQSGLGNYEYSLDNKSYQDSNTFTNLPNGDYRVYVRDKFGCGITVQDVYLLMYPKFFTPNGDGHNDTWGIKFSSFEQGLTIKIFDRYGKFIKMLSNNTDGWDGTYNEHDLPSTDYWFIVTRANGTEHRGHFSMKR